MKELVFDGKVLHIKKGNIWAFKSSKDVLFSSNILSGIDELLEESKQDILVNNENIQIIVRLKDR